MVSYASTNALSMLGGDEFDDIYAYIDLLNTTVVHKTGNLTESIDGEKTFTEAFAVTGTTAKMNVSAPPGGQAFEIISPMVDGCSAVIEANNLQLNGESFKIYGTTDMNFISPSLFIRDSALNIKFNVDEASNTTDIANSAITMTGTTDMNLISPSLLIRDSALNIKFNVDEASNTTAIANSTITMTTVGPTTLTSYKLLIRDTGLNNKIDVDELTNTTAITNSTITMTTTAATTITSGTTSLLVSGSGNNLIRATGSALVKLQIGTTEKMTVGSTANLQENVQINTDASTSISDKINTVEKTSIDATLTKNTNATITNLCATAFRVQTISGTDKINVGAATTTITNPDILCTATTRFRIDKTGAVEMFSISPSSFNTNPTGNATFLISGVTKLQCNAVENLLANQRVLMNDELGTERFRQITGLTTLTNTNFNLVGITNSTSYTVGTAASNIPLCSIQYQVRREMGTTQTTKFAMYQANWNTTFTSSTITNLLGFKPYGYELLVDNGTAITGTATTGTIVIDVFNDATSTVIGTATTSTVTLNNTTAQRFRGAFTSTASLAANVNFQIRFSYTVTSGTLTANVKGLTCNVYCQQI